MAGAPRDCPCFSSTRYAECCGPIHRGEASAASPEGLMRSRFAAFALGLGAYLVDTLATDHDDLDLPRDVLVRELSRARDRQRFLGLRILHTSARASVGEVLFFAKIFEKGDDRSFAELSRFARQAAGWRYASGIVVPRAELPTDLDALGPDDVLRWAAAAPDA